MRAELTSSWGKTEIYLLTRLTNFDGNTKTPFKVLLRGMKKILLIVIFILVAIGLGFSIYYVFFRAAPATVTQTPPATNELSGLPSAGPAGARGNIAETTAGALPVASPVANGSITETTSLTSGPAISPTNSLDGNNLRYYDSTSGKFLRINSNGDAVPLSSKDFPNVTAVTWSRTQDAAILEYPDASKIYYNFNTGAQYTIPKHWSDFNFSSTGEQFAAKSLKSDVDSRWLFMSNPDGSNLHVLEPLGDNADKVTVNMAPSEHIIAYGETGQAMGLGQQQIVFVGKNKENFKGLTVQGINFLAIWSSDSKQLLYSVADKTAAWKPTLWITDALGDTIGDNNRALNVETWADKCTFGSNTEVYCAIPQSMPDGAGLERDTVTSPDLVYKIDLATGIKTLLAIPQGNFNMSHLIVSADSKFLFFQDQTTNRVYKIQLAK